MIEMRLLKNVFFFQILVVVIARYRVQYGNIFRVSHILQLI